MDFQKIRCLNKQLSDKRVQLNKEKDTVKRQKLNLQIQIIALKLKLERLKKD
jgi:hypothetical protein